MAIVIAIFAAVICESKDLSGKKIEEITKEYKEFISDLPHDVVVTRQGKIAPFDYIVKEGDVIEMHKLAISQNNKKEALNGSYNFLWCGFKNCRS